MKNWGESWNIYKIIYKSCKMLLKKWTFYRKIVNISEKWRILQLIFPIFPKMELTSPPPLPNSCFLYTSASSIDQGEDYVSHCILVNCYRVLKTPNSLSWCEGICKTLETSQHKQINFFSFISYFMHQTMARG